VLYTFDQFSLDVARYELRKGNDIVRLEPHVFDLLVYLIRNRERVVSKDDLISDVWNGRIVSDSTLTSRITAVRRAVGDSGRRQCLIRTLARRGIRFVGEVKEEHRNQQAALHTGPLTATQGSEPHWYSTKGLPDKPSIAVLPFDNLSGDSDQDYFSDGIAEEVITALSQLRWFFVIARNSTFAYKGHSTDVRQIGRDLGVRYVLEGSVRKGGKRVRVTAQLVDAATGSHIWADRFDQDLTDIFALQDEVAAKVAAAVEPKLLAAENLRAEKRSGADLDAWDLVARAMPHFWRLHARESEAAISILLEAVKRYPSYAPAHSVLAFALLVAGHMGWRTNASDREAADRLARHAVQLDDADPWAYMALGYLAFVRRRTEEAVDNFKAAIEFNPNFAAAHGYAGWVLAHDGQTEEAISLLEQAIRLSPRDPFNVFYLAGFAAAHYLAGRYTVAAEWARRALRIRPEHLGARRKLVASLAQAGVMEEAESEMARLRELQPGLSIAWIRQAVPYTSKPMDQFLEGMRKAGLTD